jgi:Tol biopolymer transport system component
LPSLILEGCSQQGRRSTPFFLRPTIGKGGVGVSRAVLLSASVVLALMAACAAALVVTSMSQKAEAAFPGRNGDIAFVSFRAGSVGAEEGYPHQAVKRMRPDGSGVRRIFNGEVWTKTPAWSADGTKIAWAYDECADLNGDGPCDRINVANADGSERIVYLYSGDTFISGASWSPSWYPSGRKIVFARDVDGITGPVDLYVVSLDDAYNSTGLTRFTFTPEAIETTPDVSPDGSRIAFASNRDADYEIYVMDADAPESEANVPLKLTDNATYFDSEPDWSPDGSKIVYTSSRNGNKDVFVMNANGAGKKNLTRNAARDADPAFSPDGSFIVFESDRDGDSDIWRMRADGSNPTKLTRNTINDASPDWQPLP